MPSMKFTVGGIEHTVFGNREQINGVKALGAERDELLRAAGVRGGSPGPKDAPYPLQLQLADQIAMANKLYVHPLMDWARDHLDEIEGGAEGLDHGAAMQALIRAANERDNIAAEKANEDSGQPESVPGEIPEPAEDETASLPRGSRKTARTRRKDT